MSTYAEFRCDRCGTVERLAANQQPGNWAGLSWFEPPLSTEYRQSPPVRKHFCRTCVKARKRCRHEESLYGRCVSCGAPWLMQAIVAAHADIPESTSATANPLDLTEDEEAVLRIVAEHTAAAETPLLAMTEQAATAEVRAEAAEAEVADYRRGLTWDTERPDNNLRLVF